MLANRTSFSHLLITKIPEEWSAGDHPDLILDQCKELSGDGKKQMLEIQAQCGDLRALYEYALLNIKLHERSYLLQFLQDKLNPDFVYKGKKLQELCTLALQSCPPFMPDASEPPSCPPLMPDASRIFSQSRSSAFTRL